MHSILRRLLLIVSSLVLLTCATAKQAEATHQLGATPTTSNKRPTKTSWTSSKNIGSIDIHLIPDAIPQEEPLIKSANLPYTTLGRSFRPDIRVKPYQAMGLASWYGKKFHGCTTSSGEKYDMFSMTAAHPTLPIPSYARVTNLYNSKSVVVRVNDRGPFHKNRVIDLSYAAAHRLGFVKQGSAKIAVERVWPASDRENCIIIRPFSSTCIENSVDPSMGN
jgi:rare lipoprotein A